MDKWWDQTFCDYYEKSLDVRRIYIEPKEVALGKKVPPPMPEEKFTWDEPMLLGIQHRETADQEFLHDVVAEIREHIKVLDTCFTDERTIKPEFVTAWSRFNYCYGFILCHVLSKNDLSDQIGGQKGGEAVSKDAERKWVGILINKHLIKGVARHEADRRVAKTVVKLSKLEKPLGFDPEWFKKLLGEDGQLKSTYSRKRFPLKEIKAAIISKPKKPVPPTSF